MIDHAANQMKSQNYIACERISGINDNMSQAHFHDFFEIYFLEKGSRHHVIYDKSYQIQEGEFVIFAPYVMHYSYGEPDISFTRTVLYFYPNEILSKDLLETFKGGTGVYLPDAAFLPNIHTILESLLKEQAGSHPHSEIYQTILVNQLLIEIARQIPHPIHAEQDDRFSDIIRYLHEHHQEEIRIDMLAQKFYFSPYYLCREFKKYTNTTIITYLNTTRIMYAQRKLSETNLPITEISRQSGFSSISHFNRIFKKYTNTTPSAYRRKHKNTTHTKRC